MSGRPNKLNPDEIGQRLAKLSGWRADEGHLRKTFAFADFNEAFGWMTRVAMDAERLAHHPNWSNVYKTVEVELWTHDVGGLSELDFELAASMDRHAGS